MKKRNFFVLVVCLSLIAFLTSMSFAAPKKDIGPPSNAKVPSFAPPSDWGGALEVLSPAGVIEPAENLPIAARVDGLAGKTIGLYDNGKTGFTAFLDVVEELLHAQYPTATIIRYYGAFDMPDDMAQEIASEVDTYILGVAD